MLASDIRAAEREKFELRQKERETQKMMDDAHKKREQAEQRMEEHRKLRKSMEFKAKPYNVQTNDSFVCVPSNVGLTVPVSPHLHTKARAEH